MGAQPDHADALKHNAHEDSDRRESSCRPSEILSFSFLEGLNSVAKDFLPPGHTERGLALTERCHERFACPRVGNCPNRTGRCPRRTPDSSLEAASRMRRRRPALAAAGRVSVPCLGCHEPGPLWYASPSAGKPFGKFLLLVGT